MKGVVNKIIEGLTQPSYGAHIDLGLMVKIPVVPLGVYVDGEIHDSLRTTRQVR